MPEFFLELFSEEIPARMQARAAEDLSRLVSEALAPLSPANPRSFYGPRRIALALDVAAQIAASSSTERGPRASAPEQALAGFLRKHGATKDQLRQEGDFWVLEKASAAISAADLIAAALPALLRRFPWPKSMRWGGTSQFTWVRPLRRITCLLDGAVVPFSLADGADDGHGLASADFTEGHRFLAPGAFAVSSCADWQAKLRGHKVLTDAAERRQTIADEVAKAAAARGVTVADDPGLLDADLRAPLAPEGHAAALTEATLADRTTAVAAAAAGLRQQQSEEKMTGKKNKEDPTQKERNSDSRAEKKNALSSFFFSSPTLLFFLLAFHHQQKKCLYQCR